jgi:integrase
VQILAPRVAAHLLDALSIEDRAIWGTALYAGLRYGELRALRWGAVDFGGGKLWVRESWDPITGSIAPKTRTSKRRTPMPRLLRRLLVARREHGGAASEEELLFAGRDGAPFHAASLYRRADLAWARAGIGERLRLHQARHTYASFMIPPGSMPRPSLPSWATPRSR